MSTVETIKEKLNISDVVSRYLKLEKAGGNLKAKCPFHNEKTPSFFISPDRGTYYCFGCGAKGDIFTFVQEFERVDFVGALKILADMAGVEIVRERPKDREAKNEKERLFEIIEESVNFYHDNLSKHPEIQKYLQDRGLKEKTISDWQIGFAEEGWSNLLDHLKKKNFKELEIEKAGLIKKGEKGASFYDRFRARIMFPIFDSSGRPIAFSGRIVDSENKEAKYVNSPEGPLFNKSDVLYGYDRGKQAIRELNYAILVEGQMDLIMMHQAGLRNTVASSGTALSEGHLKILKRSSDNVLFAYDGDIAGLKAALRPWTPALLLGMEVKIAKMPEGEDPASLIAKDPELLKTALKGGKHIIDFYLDTLIDEEKDKRKLGKKVEKELLPFVRSLASNVDQTHFISAISEKTGVNEGALFEELNKIPIEEIEGVDDGRIRSKTSDDFIARRLWGMILWQEKQSTPVIDTANLRERLKEVVSSTELERRESLNENEKADLIFEAEIYFGENPALPKEAEELLANIEEDYLKAEFGKAMSALKAAEKEKDNEEVARLLKLCQELSERLSKRGMVSKVSI